MRLCEYSLKLWFEQPLVGNFIPKNLVRRRDHEDLLTKGNFPHLQRKLRGLSVPYGCFVVGLSFYLSRFPEVACRSGSMDLVGASHQIWHLNVFGGMAYWYSECASTFFGDAVCATG